MRKYPIDLQDEEKACGAYCISMILKFYGYQDEMKKIKQKARLNQNGISILGIIECLKTYQIEAKAYQATLDDIHKNIQYPCILYMAYNDIGHFVVLYERNDDEYIIGDPARGLISIYQEEMSEHYAMHVIAITHVGRVPELSYQSYFSFLYQTFQSYQKHMIDLILKGLWISLLGYLSSYFFQFIIDDIHINTQFFYMVVLCIAYSCIEIIKTRMERIRTKAFISLRKAVDEEYVFDSSMRMLQLTHSFFYQDKGYIQSQLLSLFDLSEMSLECDERLFLDALSFVVFMIGMMFINISMTFLVVIMFLCIMFMAYYRLQALQDIHKNYLEAHFVFQHHLLELIENQFLIKRFSLLQQQRERSYHIYLDEAMLKEKQALFMNQLQSFIQYFIYIFYGVIMILGFYHYQRSHLTIGQLMMFYMLVSYCIQPVMNIVNLVSQYKQMKIVYEKYKVFEIEPQLPQEPIKEKITSITLDNVSYAYGYQVPLFEHIDLTIHQHLLLKGKTGSGKSKLLRLFMGYDLHYSGDIYINDQELRTIQLSSLYQHIGYAHETPSFLHLTLLENFLCHDEKKIRYYLKSFGQEALFNMFHIVLSEDGAPLSLGQRQIVSLIRLLCQEFDILILDEAFSHMDAKLASKVMRFLFKNDEGKIYVMVNHQTKLVNKNVACAIIEEGRLRNER